MLRREHFAPHPPGPCPAAGEQGSRGEKLPICIFWAAKPPKRYRMIQFPALGAGLGVGEVLRA